MTIQSTVAVLSPLSVLLWSVSVTFSTGKVLCIQIYLNGMFYQRENIKSAKHFHPNTINNVAAYLDLHFTTVNIICTYSFFVYFVRCFLYYALIKKATMISNFKNQSRVLSDTLDV